MAHVLQITSNEISLIRNRFIIDAAQTSCNQTADAMRKREIEGLREHTGGSIDGESISSWDLKDMVSRGYALSVSDTIIVGAIALAKKSAPEKAKT